MAKLSLSVSILFGLTHLFHGSDCWLFGLWGPTCYTEPPIGCFPTSEPWTNAQGLAPQDPDVISTSFSLHRAGESALEFTLGDADQVIQDYFDTLKKSIFIIHGYVEHSKRNWVFDMVSELQAKDDANIITVDWGPGATSVYYQSVANTRVVGAILALLLESLESKGSALSRVHLIGFSLGAHIAGYAGARVPGVGRISGLDPAGPAFEGTPAEVRLDPSDADMVDVMHTDGTDTVGYGTMQAMGDIDFYPNSGSDQPACPTSLLGRVSSLFTTTIDRAVACSHFFVLDLFTASINNVCPETSLSVETLHLSFTTGNSSGSGSEWQHCQDEASCPTMGYNMDADSVELYRHQVPAGGKLLVAMETSESWPFC